MNIVILLAGGESSRTTNMKQLYKVDGEYLINKQIKIIQSYGYEVVVVLGHEYEKIKSVLDKDVKIIRNYNYQQGMFSSVKTAFNLLDADKLIFCHIDRPIVEKDIFEELLKSDDEIVTTFYNGKKAPPIMIKYSMKKELLDSNINRLDYWIESTNKASYIEVDDEKVHFNANTDEKLRRYFG
ncbi:MAG: NTP transferase domain-containing protein [Campylobacterota bacterium]|nr:NTP transferase domain-containing protein [Campylobacterota bacterium]